MKLHETTLKPWRYNFHPDIVISHYLSKLLSWFINNTLIQLNFLNKIFKFFFMLPDVCNLHPKKPPHKTHNPLLTSLNEGKAKKTVNQFQFDEWTVNTRRVALVSHFYSLRFHCQNVSHKSDFSNGGNGSYPPGGRNRSGLNAARSDATKTKTTNVRFVSNGDGNRTPLSLSLSLSRVFSCRVLWT
jgi:hypothetical protein